MGWATPRPCLALLRVGFTMPRPSPVARCALTAPFHPCLSPRAIGGLLSVALSVASRRPAVSRHPALWSSDFPRHPEGCRDPHSPPARVLSTVPRRGLEPPRRLRHQILSLACLPVSAPGQSDLLAAAGSAPERTRTSTGLRPLDPESSASTNSATGAHWPSRRARRKARVDEGSRRSGAPGEIRTPGLLIRSQTLYPAELRAHKRTYLIFNAPSRNRTYNLGIKSPLLCQLSYRCGSWTGRII